MDASSASGSSRSSGIGPTQAWLRNYAATARPNMHDSGSDCDNNSDGDRRTVLSKMHEDLRQIWAPDLVGRKGTEAAVGPECLVLTKTRSSDIQNSTSCCSGGSPRPGRRDGDRRNIPDGGAGTGSGRGRAGLSQGSSGTDPWALHRVLTAGSRPCVSDEHYLPTLLASYGLDYQTDCLGEAHFVDWTSGGGWHPRSFLPSDIRGLEWESAAGGGGGPTARGSVDRRLGEEFLRWLEAGFSLFRGPTGPLGAAARPARLPDGRRLWGPDEGCWIRPNGCGGGGSQPSRHGASASLESLSHVFVMQSPGTKSLVATAELDPEPASTDEGKGKGRGVGAHEGAQERTGATVNEGTTVQLHAVQEGRAAPDVAAVAESPTLRSWLENLHYMPLGYRCHLFARKFPAVSARSSLHLALACPPRGLGLGAWCWRGQGLHPSPPQR
ncbi:hypothetical protein Vretimale_8778 [Volvox reticuliferus]|nr:hypothetical protein Vretimale_8778 [Volvox reticuliferus]